MIPKSVSLDDAAVRAWAAATYAWKVNGTIVSALARDLLDARQALSDRDTRVKELRAWIAKSVRDHGWCVECGKGSKLLHSTKCSVPRLLAESSDPYP